MRNFTTGPVGLVKKMNKQPNISQLIVGVILFLGGLCFLAGLVTPLAAATIHVTTALDENDGSCSDGDCSVRDAIATAVSGDTIAIPSGSYLLTLGELVVSQDLILVGDSPAPVLDGNASSRVLQVAGDVSLTLNNLIVTNGNDVDGGGIAVYGSRLTLLNSEVSENAASNNGGGIFIGTSGTVTLTSSKVSQNVAAVSGGGVYDMDGSLVQAGGTIENNSAGTGGGVYVNLIDASYTLNDGMIWQNSSTTPEKGGGGIYVSAGTATINGGQIAENSGARGGGIQSANGIIYLNGGSIQNNQADHGGGVYLAFPEAFLSQNGGDIIGNSANSPDFGGGGVLGFQGSMELTAGLISQNSSASEGGGLKIRFGDLTITGGMIEDNQAVTQGGGIFAEQSTLSISNLQLGNNTAVTGGGLYLDSLATLDLSKTAVYSNTASTNGGGLYLKGAALVTNVTISSNEAQNNGGGIWAQNGSTTLNNVTLSQNTAVSGGGIYNNSATVTLHNTLLAENSATIGPECSGSSLTSDGYNLIQNSADCLLGGDLTGNIMGQDPLLQSLTLLGEPTYIHPLSAASPAIDMGDPVVCLENDQHSRPRPMDGDLNGTAVCDMGAFEYGLPLRVGDVSISEGNSGSTMANFPVALDFATSVTITVAYASSDQSAVAGLDYAAVSGTFTFSPGQTAKNIAVPILGDLLDEDDETFLIIAQQLRPTPFLAKDQGIGTILDNDPVPSLSINDVTLSRNGDSGNLLANFIVTLSDPKRPRCPGKLCGGQRHGKTRRGLYGRQ